MFDMNLAKRIAELSKFNLTDSELVKISKDMYSIMALMDTITDFNINNDFDYEDAAVDYAFLREDIVYESSSRDEILSNSKECSKTYYKVPKVV